MSQSTRQPAASPDPEAVISFGDDPNALIPVAVLRKSVGLGDWAYRSALREGLITTQIGNRVFVRASDWWDYLDRRRGRSSGPQRGDTTDDE